jgi:hypothetical protein
VFSRNLFPSASSPYSYFVFYSQNFTSTATHNIDACTVNPGSVYVIFFTIDRRTQTQTGVYIAHLPQQFHNSKFVIFQEKLLKVLKCYNLLSVQQRHNCSPAESFANCVMTLYLLKVHLQTFFPIPITQKCQILSCDTLVANDR